MASESHQEAGMIRRTRFMPWSMWALMVAVALVVSSCAAHHYGTTERHWAKEVITTGDWVDPEEEIDPLIPPYDPIHGAGEADQIKARFRGTDRKVAKTSAVDKPV